jgi:hypothetical protein
MRAVARRLKETCPACHENTKVFDVWDGRSPVLMYYLLMLLACFN